MTKMVHKQSHIYTIFCRICKRDSSDGKGQREHGSVEMLLGWTMSFPEPPL